MKKKSSSKSSKKGRSKEKNKPLTVRMPTIIKDDKLYKGLSSRKRSFKRITQPFLIENSEYKFADLQGAKEKWCQKLLIPSMQRPIPSRKPAVSYKPIDNVVGVGIGEKTVDGKPTGILAVRFLVRSKKSRSLVEAKHLLPKTIDGLPVDVKQVGTFHSLAADGSSPSAPNPRLVIRPARPGCSIGFVANGFRNAGTFGALVKNSSGTFILSNNHVLADENNLNPGALISQPGSLDDSNVNSHQIARLAAFAELLHGEPNTIDCALARVSNVSQVSNSILFIGPPRGTTAPFSSMAVHKFGRSSGFTVGRVTDIDMDITLQYDTGRFLFLRQIIIDSGTEAPFAETGDSGALVLERSTQKAVGLLIARSSNGTSAVANHITDVLDALEVRLA